MVRRGVTLIEPLVVIAIIVAIRADDDGDRAPAGTHRVSIFRGGGSESEGLHVLKSKAADPCKKDEDPEGSGLTISVKPGSHDLEPFLLSTGAAR
jgi:hypothetical protein